MSGLDAQRYKSEPIIDRYFFLIEGFSLLICIKKTTRGHGSLDGFAVDEIKLLQEILEVFFLRYKSAILLLTDLKSEEKLQFTHHGHFIFLRRHFCKLFA